MTVEELARLARQMRRAQDAYFRTRGSEALRAARALEALVDAAVADVLAGQGDLFAGSPLPGGHAGGGA